MADKVKINKTHEHTKNLIIRRVLTIIVHAAWQNNGGMLYSYINLTAGKSLW